MYTSAICNLARMKSAMGQTIQLGKLLRDVIPIAERSLGMNHFGTLAGKVHFPQVPFKQKRYGEAEEVFFKVVEKQMYANAAREDGDHPDRIMALWYLVECYAMHGKVKDALTRVDELENVIATIGGEGLRKLHPFKKRLTAKREELERIKEGIGNGEISIFSSVESNFARGLANSLGVAARSPIW